MSGIKTLLDTIQINLRSDKGDLLPVYVNVYDNSLSRKWLTALNHLIGYQYHLEKNYCFFGFPDGPRNGQYIVDQINATVKAINAANIGYAINNNFTLIIFF